MSSGHFLARGRIPALLTASRRDVGKGAKRFAPDHLLGILFFMAWIGMFPQTFDKLSFIFVGCSSAGAPERLLLEEKLAPPQAVTDVVCGRMLRYLQHFGEIVLR